MNYYYCDDGKLFVLGANDYFNLGLGHIKDVSSPQLLMTDINIKIIATSKTHTLILKTDGKLYICGTCIKIYKTPQLLIQDQNIKSIHCGYKFSLIYKNNGELLVLGKNDEGQLGFGNYEHMPMLTLLMNDKNIKQISCGTAHCMILKNNGELYTFGDNQSGQLGLGSNIKYKVIPTLLMTNINIKSVSCGDDYSTILMNNCDIFTFGSNSVNQLGCRITQGIMTTNIFKPILNDSNIIKDVKSISNGSNHTLILKHNGDLIGYGSNRSKQLFTSKFLHTEIWIPTLIKNDTTIKHIYCGCYSSMILKYDGELIISQNGDNNYISIKFENIKAINGMEIMPSWSRITHKYYTETSQQQIFTFLLIIKRNELIKPPKYIFINLINLFL